MQLKIGDLVRGSGGLKSEVYIITGLPKHGWIPLMNIKTGTKLEMQPEYLTKLEEICK
jgi:hypothetical protein